MLANLATKNSLQLLFYVHQIQDIFTECISNYNSDQEVFHDLTSASINNLIIINTS